LIDYAVNFLSRYLYAIVFSTLATTVAFVLARLANKRAYKKRTTLFILSLFGSFLIAIWIASVCFSHWFNIGYDALYHVACSDVSLSYIKVICAGWVTLMTGAFSLAFAYGIINYCLGERIASRVYHIKPLGQDHAVDFHKMLAGLSQKAGINVPRVGLIENSTPNIFSIGTKKRSMIVVSVGLFETLSSDELEASLAHEVAHINNKDGLIKSLALSLKFAAPFNFSGFLIEPALCRDREFLADEESVRITKKPRALISALTKLSGSFAAGSGSTIYTSFAMRFLAPRTSRWNFFSRHPSVIERLERLSHLEDMITSTENS